MTATATVIKQILNGHFQHDRSSILVDLILLRLGIVDRKASRNLAKPKRKKKYNREESLKKIRALLL